MQRLRSLIPFLLVAAFCVAAVGGLVRLVQADVNPDLATNVVIEPTLSNGTTAVSLVAAVDGRPVLPYHLTIRNTDTAVHTVYLQSDSTKKLPIRINGSTELFFDNVNQLTRTARGEALKFSCDSGASNLVEISGAAFQ